MDARAQHSGHSLLAHKFRSANLGVQAWREHSVVAQPALLLLGVQGLGFRTLEMVRLKLTAATSLVVKHLPRCVLNLMVGLGNDRFMKKCNKLKAEV